MSAPAASLTVQTSVQSWLHINHQAIRCTTETQTVNAATQSKHLEISSQDENMDVYFKSSWCSLLMNNFFWQFACYKFTLATHKLLHLTISDQTTHLVEFVPIGPIFWQNHVSQINSLLWLFFATQAPSLSQGCSSPVIKKKRQVCCLIFVLKEWGGSNLSTAVYLFWSQPQRILCFCK